MSRRSSRGNAGAQAPATAALPWHNPRHPQFRVVTVETTTYVTLVHARTATAAKATAIKLHEQRKLTPEISWTTPPMAVEATEVLS